MSNDLISREALKKEVESLVVGGAEGLKDYYENGSKSDENSWIGGVYDAWELINNAPTVEPNWKFYFDHGYAQAKKDLKMALDKQMNFEENCRESVFEIIDNATPVCGNNPKWCESCVSKGKCASTRPQGGFDYKVINRGNCMLCGKELTEGLFFCKECEEKRKSKEE